MFSCGYIKIEVRGKKGRFVFIQLASSSKRKELSKKFLSIYVYIFTVTGKY